MKQLSESILDEVLADLEAQGVELSAVVRERATELAMAAADVAARSITGHATQLEHDALRVRAANLEAAVSIGVGALVAQAAQRAILKVLKVAFAALA